MNDKRFCHVMHFGENECVEAQGDTPCAFPSEPHFVSFGYSDRVPKAGEWFVDQDADGPLRGMRAKDGLTYGMERIIVKGHLAQRATIWTKAFHDVVIRTER